MKKRKLLLLLCIGMLCLPGCSGKEETGEAVFESITDVNSISEAKTARDENRSQIKESLMEVINSENITDEKKQSAIDEMVQMTDIAEKELAAETLLISQGYEEAFVSINDSHADVLVVAAELNDAQRAEIEDIVKRKTGLEAENIAVTYLSTSESE